MRLRSAFWDSSALIPLCVRESTTDTSRVLTAQFALAVWWGTVVEIRGAIARQHRSRNLNALERQEAMDRLSVLQDAWHEILPSDEVRELAGALLDTHPSRAADSLQLAAALIWCQQRPAGRSFISGDIRLCEAASLAGFTVIRLGSSNP